MPTPQGGPSARPVNPPASRLASSVETDTRIAPIERDRSLRLGELVGSALASCHGMAWHGPKDVKLVR